MKHLAPYDRPREKLERLGPGSLGDNELLAVILGSGSRDAGALALANQILASVDGIYGLMRTDRAELMRISGVGRARAAQVLAAVELGRRTLVRGPIARARLTSPREIALHLLPQFGASPVEQFGVVLLDSKHRVTKTSIVAVGGLNTTGVEPHDVYREAVLSMAAAIVVFHNHPSGDPSPSPDDIELTNRLAAAGVLLGIDLVDHIVLGDVRYCSFKEMGKL